MQIFFICSLIFIVSTVIIWLIRTRAIRKNILDIPNERSSHHVPTPRGGGLGIVLIFSLVVLLMAMNGYLASNIAFALEGGILVAAIGYVDDLQKISMSWRILVHVAAALWAIYWLHGLPLLDLGTWQFTLNGKGNLLAFIGIIWLINLYNFMDGIDGLAGSQGLFAALAGATALWILQDPYMAVLLLMLAASIAGFTILNWPPAKIFLGDVGSGYLGYIFAVIGLYTTNTQTIPSFFWIIIFAIFICDATFTLIYRAFKGKKWYSAHREHAYQQLISYGATHQQVTFGILIVNVIFILPIAFIALQWRGLAFSLLMILVTCLLLTWIIINLLRTAKT